MMTPPTPTTTPMTVFFVWLDMPVDLLLDPSLEREAVPVDDEDEEGGVMVEE